MSVKIDRIASNMVKEISYILANEVKNNNIKFVTVTDVKLASDLSYAKVYVTVFDQEKIKDTLKALEQSKGFIRKKLAERIDIRHTPELSFVFDESIEYGNKIEKIIEKINEK